jgi:hypothetical protein
MNGAVLHMCISMSSKSSLAHDHHLTHLDPCGRLGPSTGYILIDRRGSPCSTTQPSILCHSIDCLVGIGLGTEYLVKEGPPRAQVLRPAVHSTHGLV